MVEIIVQPLGVLLGVAIAGIFSGIGLALGSLIITYWIEPRIKKWRRKHKKVFSALRNSHNVNKEDVK